MGNIRHLCDNGNLYTWRGIIVKNGKTYQILLCDESPDTMRVPITPKFTSFKNLVKYMQELTFKQRAVKSFKKYSFRGCYKWLRECYVKGSCPAW